MVLKKMLKGFGRLMLTTGLLCGVGLFLCATDVKAAGSVAIDSVVKDSDGNIKISFVTGTSGIENAETIMVDKVKFNSGNEITYSTPKEVTVTNNYITVSKADIKKAANITTAGDYNISFVNCSCKVTGVSEYSSVSKSELGVTNYLTFYEISAKIDKTKYNVSLSNMTISIEGREPVTGLATTKLSAFGCSGDKFSISCADAAGKYYENVGATLNWYDANTGTAKWAEANTSITNVTIGTSSEEYVIQYFPIIESIELPSDLPENIYLDENGAADLTIEAPVVNFKASSEQATFATQVSTNTTATKTNIKYCDVGYETITINKLTNNAIPGELSNYVVELETPAHAKVTNIMAKSSEIVDIRVYPYATKLVFDPATVNVGKGDTEEFTPILYPYGADVTDLEITSVTPASSSKYEAEVTSDGTGIEIEGIAATTSAVTLTVKGEAIDADGTHEVTGTIKVNVIDDEITSIKVVPTSVTVGTTTTITATITPKAGASQFTDSVATGLIGTSDDSVFDVTGFTADASTGKVKITVKGKTVGSAKLIFKYDDDGEEKEKEFTFNVYSKPTLTLTKSSSTISKMNVTIPDGVSGYDTVTGFRLYGYKSDISSPIYDSGSTYNSTKSKEFSASDINSIINSIDKTKFSGDSDSIKFVAVPVGTRDGSSKCDKSGVISDAVTVDVYKASVSGTGISGSYAYGIAGQKVSISAYPTTGYASVKWSDGSTANTKEVTLSTSTSSNQLKAEGVLSAQSSTNSTTGKTSGGTGTGSDGTGSGLYDDVPKTAESNSAIWLIVFMVFAVMGTAYALYLQLKAATSKNDK